MSSILEFKAIHSMAVGEFGRQWLLLTFLLQMSSLVFHTLIFWYWGLFQHLAVTHPYLPPSSLLITCSDQQNHVYNQEDDKLWTLCLQNRDTDLPYLRTMGFASRIGLEQVELLTSSHCRCYWDSTFVHTIILWSGRMVLGPNLASKFLKPSWNSSCITIQCISLSRSLAVGLHHNLNIEVFGQNVRLLLFGLTMLPSHKWQTVQLGCCAQLSNSRWHDHYHRQGGSTMAFLLLTYHPDSPSSAPYHDGGLYQMCTSYFNYHLNVYSTFHGIYIASLHINQRPQVSLSLDLQMEPILLHIFSIHSKFLSISHVSINLSWSLTYVGLRKLVYRLSDADDRQVWSTFYNPYALLNNFSVDDTTQRYKKKVVASIFFCTDEEGLGGLRGELRFSKATLSLTSKNEPRLSLTLKTQKIKVVTYIFSHTLGLFYSTQRESAFDIPDNVSGIHHIFYQQKSLSYLFIIEFVQSRWYKLSIHLYLNGKGALLRSFSENNIEIHIFNSGPSLLQTLVYIVWFIPIQHPLLHGAWAFNLQFFDSEKERLIRNDTYTYRDHVRHASRFIPQSFLPFNPALYTGFVAQMNCTRSGLTHVALKAAIKNFASKTVETTLVCHQRLCSIKRVNIQKPVSSHFVLNFSKQVPFLLTADTQVNCPNPVQRDNIWNVYKIPNVKTSPDWSRPLNPPGIRRQNLTIEVPGSSLDVGFYLFKFMVRLTTADTLESMEDSDFVLIQIKSKNLEAVIAGGNSRTVDFSNQWTLDGSASSDPDSDQPSGGLLFTWYCTRQKADYVSMILSENGKCHLHQEDLKWTMSTDPVQTVQSGTLLQNTIYYFRLVVQKGSRTAQTEQMVHVQSGSALILNVTCIENCGRSVIPTEKFCLRGKCLNCNKSSKPVYHWSLFSDSCTEINFDWGSESTTGRSKPYLCINSLTRLNMTEPSYTLVLNVSTLGDQSSVYNYLFFINSPPLIGKCVLNPWNGIVLLTRFIVHCSGFKDKHLPLTYKVKAVSDMTSISAVESNVLGATVYFGYQSKTPPSFLPTGVPSKKYSLTIYVEVYDALGAYSQVILQAMVHGPLKDTPADVILNELHGLTSGPEAPITYYLKSGDYFNAGYFVYMVASTLNNIEALPRLCSFKTQLREILLNKSTGIPARDVIEINQVVSSIFQITHEVTEVSRKSQLLAVRKLKELTEELRRQSREAIIGSKEILALGISILAGLSNVLKASLLDRRNVHINGVKETFSVTESLADLVLRRKTPGENETVLESENWSITLRKDEKWDVSGACSKGKSCKNCFYPKIEKENSAAESSGDDIVVSTILYQLDNNPFPGLPDKEVLGTTVTGFKMTETRSNGDIIGMTPEVVEAIMSRKHKDSAMFDLTIGCTRKCSKTTGGFRFEVCKSSKDLFIQIITKLKLRFQIFIYLNDEVSQGPLASFSISHNKPSVAKGKNSSDGECTLRAPYIFCLSQTLLRSIFQKSKAEKLHISAVLHADPFVRNQNTPQVSIVLFSANCLYLDGVQSQWKEGPCKLGPQTDWQKLHCICTTKKRVSRTANPPPSKDDIKFLAGKVILHPKPTDMEKILLTKVHKNPVSTLTIVFIFVVYSLLTIWTMRKDKADLESRDQAIVLPDNDPFDKVCYLITVYTGCRFGAGTTADIFIQLIGQNGVSDIHCLRHPKYLTFGRGARDTFLLTSKNDLGEVYSFRVWHNNRGSSPNWFLSRIQVENIYTKQTWMFICQKWFALNKDDGLTDRSFVVTHPKLPLKKMDFFLINLANDLANNHICLSVFTRVSTGSLNRLQRLSCCLATLMCMLLFNVMFFSADGTQQLASIQLPFLKSVIIGIQSAFISLPLQLIITALFKHSQKQTSPQATTQTQPKEYSALMSGNLWNWKECLQKWYLAETASKGPGCLFPEIPNNVSDSCSRFQFNEKRQIQAEKQWTNCMMSEGEANVIAAEDLVQDASDNNNCRMNCVEKAIDPQIKQLNVPIMLFRKRPQLTFSWWRIYISWILIFAISTFSSFFIILQGLSYDYETSVQWLKASALSFFVGMFLLQIPNPVVVSALKTLKPRYCESIPWSSRETYLEIKLDDGMMDADEMRELHYELIRARGTNRYQPLTEDEVTIFRKRQKVQHQAFVFIKGVTSHFVFLILILKIAYSRENTTSFYYNQFIHSKFSLGLSNVGKVEHIYLWLNEVFLPLIHNDYHPNYLSDTWSKIVGLPRMRQIRAKNTRKECFYPHSFVHKFVISSSHCLHKYGYDPEDRMDYLGSWRKPTNKSVFNDFSNFSDPSYFYHANNNQWTYTSHGEQNTYKEGGYTFNFYPEEKNLNSTKRIASLIRSRWLDGNTWAVIVELTVFNSDVDLFCSITLVFEMSYLGPVNTSLSIHSYKLPIFKQLSTMQKFVYVAAICILALYIIDELWVVKKQRLKYLNNVSNLINFGIKALGSLFLLQLASKFKLASSLVDFYLLHPDEFIPLHNVSQVDKTLRITLSFLIFLIILKTLRYSRFFYDVRLAQRSILAALPGICSMALVVAVYFFVYMAFGYLVFGQYEWNYNTMVHSAQTVFSYCVSAFKDTAFTYNRLFGGLFLASFMMVMICVLINLFQAVILSAYEEMKQPVYEEPSEEAEVVNFLVHKIRRMWYFVSCRTPGPHDTELFHRVLFGHPERTSQRHLGLKSRKINGRKMVYLVI